ncbi:MAG: hydantoinase B/oxoprolinase family protein, partial [Pseudomonadota bacterium]
MTARSQTHEHITKDGQHGSGGWRFWIDRGGTFTDVIAAAPDGTLTVLKLLSDNPHHYGDAASHAIDQMMPKGARLEEVRLGTTVATNALLERRGARTALLVTKGLRDVLEIGTQHRPDLFALNVQRAAPLYEAVYEIPERMSVEGEVLLPLDDEAVHDACQKARGAGIEALSICFLHGLRHTHHETQALAIAADYDFASVVASHQASARHKLVARGQTAVADAYLSPVLRHYVDQVTANLPANALYFMKSDGGVCEAAQLRGKDAVLSGPAGGIVGAVEAAKANGIHKVIAFDMGGTSTDVAHYDGAYETADMPTIADIRLDVSMLDIHTVASGGGSILKYQDGRFQVGPQSAGAQPGPAAYGMGGPLTITDCHVLLARLQPSTFPKIFGPDGTAPLDATRVRTLFAALQEEIGADLSVEEIAQGFIDVACEQMARAIKKITQERGIDIAGHTLVAFGGAGGQCACRVADLLGIKTILVHPLAGLLSAFGIGLTSQSERFSQAVDTPFETTDFQAVESSLADQARTALPGATLRFEVDIRASGSDMALTIGLADTQAMQEDFKQRHKQRFGFAPEALLHVDTVRVIAEKQAENASFLKVSRAARSALEQDAVDAWFGAPCAAQVAYADAIERCEGPAILLGDGSTTIVEPGWAAQKQRDGSLLLARKAGSKTPAQEKPEAIALELFNHRFMAIAEQMGAVLERTAHSVNIKERLDFSCAVFDGKGNLVANAPHMPVHLGSMGETVKALLAKNTAFKPGTAFAHNDPFDGGTHLPDITVVMPVFMEGEAAPYAFVASRGHHADIGGKRPGSMPANSTHIDEEGCLLSAVPLLEDGAFLSSSLQSVFSNGPHPARAIETNLADLKAQVAACQTGATALAEMFARYETQRVLRYMTRIQDNAEAAVRRLIKRLKPGHYTQQLGDAGTIQAAITIDAEGERACVDFSSTSN